MFKLLLSALLLFTPYQATETETAIINLVDHAEHKIIATFYGFTDPALADSLIKAKTRGCQVSIVVDKTQAAGSHQKVLIKQLQSAGIYVAVGKSACHNQLIHCKAIVVDDRFVESGSLNFSASGLQQDNFIDIVDDPIRAGQFTDFWTKIDEYIRSKAK